MKINAGNSFLLSCDGIRQCVKETIRSQTDYLAQASLNMSTVRADHIFTNIFMQHVKRKERPRQYGQISGKRIKNSQEIFTSTNGKHPKFVVVTRMAGIRKTLFCQKLIRDWADDKLLRSKTNAEVPDFKFAYSLTFRQFNLLEDDLVTLKDILNWFPVPDGRSNIDNFIFEYTTHHSKEVLIIIDGYDECSRQEHTASDSHEKYPKNARKKTPVAALCVKLIEGKILRDSVVMITDVKTRRIWRNEGQRHLFW